MSRVIFCYTGTGNSLYVAKSIANFIGAKLRLLDQSVLRQSISGDYEYLGIVFPVYHQELPIMVRQFVNQFSNVRCNYVFGVSTYGDKPTLALSYLEEILSKRNMQLKSGFAVQMPYNYLRPNKFGIDMINSFTVKLPNDKKKQDILTKAENKIMQIAEQINEKHTCKAEVSDKFIEVLVDRLRLRDSVQKNNG